MTKHLLSINGRTIEEVIAHHLCVDESQVTPTADLSHDLACDSLDSVELCMKLEREFLIAIKDEYWEKVKTISDVVTVVRGLVPNLEPVQHETAN